MAQPYRLPSAAGKAEMARFVERVSGQNLKDCYQCGKCAAGCPLGSTADPPPQQVLQAIRLGDADSALAGRTLWLCVGCQTCATRCPCGVELPRIYDALRLWAWATRHPVAVREVAVFHQVFLKTVALFGRVYEVGLIAGYNTLTGHLFDSADLGWPMMTRGKISVLPARIRARQDVARIFERAAAMRMRDLAAAGLTGGAE
ncbi:MAG: 4Fe-4S dicluster domain-containing protein [Vicinamibacteria bacterium]|nr:4Fe-4S dicluster domain-containing protein [Vicinamibacteria bacterium]